MSTMTFAGAERMLPVGPGGSPALDLAGHLATHGPLAIPTRNDPGWKAVVRRAGAAGEGFS